MLFQYVDRRLESSWTSKHSIAVYKSKMFLRGFKNLECGRFYAVGKVTTGQTERKTGRWKDGIG